MLQQAILWRERSSVGRILHLKDALSLYLRNHFTIEYENTMLGFVFIGAAILIIIIGLRGLQFIPKDKPSLVLFAISLEFILLIIYAITLIYTKQTEEKDAAVNEQQFSAMFTGQTGASSSKQAEKLLRMFVSTSHQHKE